MHVGAVDHRKPALPSSKRQEQIGAAKDDRLGATFLA
jgi:hypothetical protein